MYFEKCDIKEIKKRQGERYCNFRLLERFAESEYDAVELKDYRHKNVKSLQTSLIAAAKKLHLYNIKCAVRENRVYLYKKSSMENEKRGA